LPRLEIRPPDVVGYFVQVKTAVYDNFVAKHNLEEMPRRRVEDEIVFQNSFRLNSEFYSSVGETRAFVLSHGKNLLVMKAVAYADDVVRYYQLEDLLAHVWIGHHRYPTKGRVWHPGGAHPFIGLNEALVHNGDFANYASIGEYLAQRNIYPLFLTDTEVSVQVFDLLRRTYDYPLEYVIEALAPTTERDFTMLPAEKQELYQMLQVTHMHSSPDGPWFFIIAQSEEEAGEPVYRLTAITDTSMLRPQVFAWQQAAAEGPAIGFAASEKQAIDASLRSLAGEDGRFWSRADKYWNARGGSHTDGGAFIFTARPQGDGVASLTCTDKFGRAVGADLSKRPYRSNGYQPTAVDLPAGEAPHLFRWITARLPQWDYEQVRDVLHELEARAHDDAGREQALGALTLLMDRRYPTGALRRSSLLALYDKSLHAVVEMICQTPSARYVYSCAGKRYPLRNEGEQTAVIDAAGFEPEGPDAVSAEIVRLYGQGFRRFIVADARGRRFIGNGLGPGSEGVRIDVYGSSGDYLASGIDGAEIHVHGNGQDQLAQIMRAGKLVVHGDVGQTFAYAAKGGEIYVLGNAAGRPFINAVGSPRAVINGTCLDYLAESFMAGDPYDGGGFVILNGITLSDEGAIEPLPEPYPGGNLFSLASGGAIFVRDPQRVVTADQLNGGAFMPFEERDWTLIKPYLEENARQFDIPVAKLLEVNGERRRPEEVYVKIRPSTVRALQAEEAWVREDH
jgi:glutamate synthase domain-containing protein 3